MDSLTEPVLERPISETSPETSHEITDTARTPSKSLAARAGFRQLVKFCLVGVSSTVVDKGSYWLLQNSFPHWPWWFCMAISFSMGVSNGFIWNRLWTFNIVDETRAAKKQQYAKFFISNMVGFALNIAFTKLFLIVFTGQVWHEKNPPPLHVIIASLCAAPIVVIWNFTVAKYWTFRKA